MTKKSTSTSLSFMILLAVSSIALIMFTQYLKVKGNLATPLPTTQIEGVILDDFPGFPFYPGADVQSSQRTTAYGNQPESYQAYFESRDSVSKIVKWYKENLVKEGWKIEPTSDTTQVDKQTLNVSNNAQVATVFIENEGKETFISVHIQ